MSTQPVSMAVAGKNGTYDTLSGKISELTRLEQNIKKMKSEYEQYSKSLDSSSPGVNAKIEELDGLISKVQRQIEQIKRDEKKQNACSSESTGCKASSYKYLGSVIGIYKMAFSIANRTCSEARAALSGGLHAPTASPSEVKRNMSLSSGDVENDIGKINAAQADSPGAAISAAFSDGIDVLW